MKNICSERTEDSLRGVRRAYFDYKLSVSQKYLSLLLLLASLMNALLLIPDLALIQSEAGRIGVILLRVAFSFSLLGIGLGIKEIKAYRLFSLLITLCEILAFAVFIYVLCQYGAPNFLIQAMGIVTIIILAFFVPNRWEYTLLVAVLGTAGFFVCTLLFVKSADRMEFWAAFVYVIIALLLCAIAAKNAENHEFREFAAKNELKRISSTDYLTDAANRYKMEEEAGRWMDFCRRNGMPLSLVFLDVDDLKSINDRYGHPAGDSVLSNLVKLINGQLRSSDLLARWGGDEFVMLLPNVSLDEAGALTQRIRDSVRESRLSQEVSVTCSFGVVEMADGMDFKTLISKADQMMYEGKKEGKDNVRCARRRG
ncbi:MAG TPA: GGDEF domain-containing protein [Oscillospiraceae bacterium]|nr:GGDEF domain-containing protein [Oscillospiraceae bacterium]